MTRVHSRMVAAPARPHEHLLIAVVDDDGDGGIQLMEDEVGCLKQP